MAAKKVPCQYRQANSSSERVCVVVFVSVCLCMCMCVRVCVCVCAYVSPDFTNGLVLILSTVHGQSEKHPGLPLFTVCGKKHSELPWFTVCGKNYLLPSSAKTKMMKQINEKLARTDPAAPAKRAERGGESS